MSAHILPKVLKLGQYSLDKETFTLKHDRQRRDSSGRKRVIEYPCDKCGSIYKTKLRDEISKEYPWICRSCRTKLDWTKQSYRKAHADGITETTRLLQRANRSRISKARWRDPIKRAEMIQKLRERPAEIYSKARRKMRNSTVVKHWKTGIELVCVASYELAFVTWCNQNQFDFDWQIEHVMPDNRRYIIDAFAKDGPLAGLWLEIKGYLGANNSIGKQKWEWFHQCHVNDSKLLNQGELKKLGIL